MVFFVFGGIAAAAALQEIYEQAFDLPHRRIKDLPHRLAWLAALIGASLLTGLPGPGLRHAGGPALLAVAGLVWATGFWWLTMRILLAGRISWRALFPAACATGVLYVAMQTVFSLVFSAMVISDEHTYGPIGTIFALLSYLIAIGVVVILGAVAGRAWHERSPGTSETGRLPPARPFSVATACACPGGDGRVLRKMLTTAATVAVLLMVLGELLRVLLHFTIGSLSIAGGVILLVIAVWMVLAPPTDSSHRDAGKDPMQLAQFPLAVPYLLNPVGIVGLMTISAEADSLSVFAVEFGILVFVLLLDVVVFRWANRVSEKLDESRMLVTEKVFGFLIAAIAVQLVLDGLSQVGVIAPVPH